MGGPSSDGDLGLCLDGDRKVVSTKHLPGGTVRSLEKFPPDQPRSMKCEYLLLSIH